MKRTKKQATGFWISLVVLVVSSALWVVLEKEEIEVLHLTWRDRGSYASVELTLHNRSESPNTIIVTMIAERHTEGRGGVKVMEVGRTELEVFLDGFQEKQINKTLPIELKINGHLTVTTIIREKSFNKALHSNSANADHAS